MLVLCFTKVSSAQQPPGPTIVIDRDTPTLAFNDCNGIVVTYSISVTGTATNLNITDQFTSACGVNATYDFTGLPQPLNMDNSATTSAGGIDVTIPSLTDASTTFAVLINYDQTAAANFLNIELCSNGPLVTTSTPGASISSITGPYCITITNTNKWKSTISCPPMGSYNCYTYRVSINSDLCMAYNLTGNSRHKIQAPIGALITGVAGFSGFGVTINSGINTNEVDVLLIPSSGQWIAGTSYQFKYTVEYPCIVFAEDQSVSTNLTSSFCTGSWCRFYSPPHVPNPYICGNPPNRWNSMSPILGETRTHILPKPATDGNLIVSREYTEGHDAAGCQNVLKVGIKNLGSTRLIDITYDMVVPPNVSLKCLNGGTISAFKTSSGGTWTKGVPPSISLVREIRWQPNNDTISCKSVCEKDNPMIRTIGGNIRICYEISPSASVGSNVDFCVNASYSDNLKCIAQNCIPDPFTSYTDNACHKFDVTSPEPYLKFSKTKSAPIVFPTDPLTFFIETQNCGSGNLIETLTDAIDPDLTIIGIDFEYIDAAVSSSYAPGDNGWASDNTTGNSVSIDVDIPGSCLLAGNCCSEPICNRLKVIIKTAVKPCIQASNKMNTASLSGNHSTPFYQNSASYAIRNRNQLNAFKKVKGDITTSYNDFAFASPNSNVTYQIKVYNNNPQRWHDPVVVDVLPRNGTTTFCSYSTSSAFDVKLASAITNANIVLPSSNISVVSIKHGTNTVTSDNEICGGPLQITNGFGSPNDGSFKIKFDGYLDCGDTITITFPGIIVGGTSGQQATNMAYVRQKNAQMQYTPQFGVDATLEIEDWTPNCCKNEIETRWVGEKWKGNNASIGFDIQNGSMVPVQKVRVSVVDFSYQSVYDDCRVCHTPSNNLATIHPKYGYSNLEGLVPDKSRKLNRERTWDLGSAPVTGTPILLNNWTRLKLDLQMPSTLEIPCCAACVYVCFKIEVTDVNCNTCEAYICRRIMLPEKKKKPNQTACQNKPYDKTDQTDDSGYGPVKPCPTCPGGDVIIKDDIDFKKFENIKFSPKGPK
jgi:uncharacterized repeat protein (TIGR01451 family)